MGEHVLLFDADAGAPDLESIVICLHSLATQSKGSEFKAEFAGKVAFGVSACGAEFIAAPYIGTIVALVDRALADAKLRKVRNLVVMSGRVHEEVSDLVRALGHIRTILCGVVENVALVEGGKVAATSLQTENAASGIAEWLASTAWRSGSFPHRKYRVVTGNGTQSPVVLYPPCSRKGCPRLAPPGRLCHECKRVNGVKRRQEIKQLQTLKLQLEWAVRQMRRVQKTSFREASPGEEEEHRCYICGALESKVGDAMDLDSDGKQRDGKGETCWFEFSHCSICKMVMCGMCGKDDTFQRHVRYCKEKRKRKKEEEEEAEKEEVKETPKKRRRRRRECR